MKRTYKTIVSMIIIVVVFAIAGLLRPENISTELIECYDTVLLTGFISSIAFLLAIYANEFDILEPVGIISVPYFLIFIYAPLRCISENDIYAVGGVNVMGGCVKAQWIFCVSYIVFLLGYYSKRNIAFGGKSYNYRFKDQKKDIIIQDVIDGSKIGKYSLFLWIACYGISCIYDFSRGSSPLYFFSFGLIGNGGDESLNNTVAVLGNFSYSLLACWLYIKEYTKNKTLVIITGLLTASTYFTRGFRFIMVAMILAPLVFGYLKKGKRPKVTYVILMAILILIGCGQIETIRGSLRDGSFHLSILIPSVSPLELMDRVFSSDFTIFKQFYALVENMPKRVDYLYGYEMFIYTFVMMIPRRIWVTKPSYPFKTVLTNVLNRQAMLAGQAWPNLGAFYMEFGVVGCLFFMYLFGRIMRRVKNWRFKEYNGINRIIAYSVVYSALIQVVCRGCVPQIFWMLAFMLFPIVFIRFFVGKSGGELS